MSINDISPVWSGGSLPEFVRPSGAEESAVARARYLNMTEIRATDTYESPLSSDKYCSVAIQNGFLLDNATASTLDALVSKFSPNGVICWPIDGPGDQCFSGTYNDDFRDWINRGIVSSPVAVLSADTDLLLVIDDIVVFTQIIAGRDEIEEIKKAFGGGKEMRTEFLAAIEDYYPDSDRDLRDWVEKNVVSHCDW